VRHRNQIVGLNRTASHRKALLANLASALFTYKKIITTLPKARAARSYAERLITFARRGDLAARRHVLRKIHDKDVVKELFDQIGPKFQDRNGGYTRILRLDNRPGDNAPMAVLELIGFIVGDAKKAKVRKGKKAIEAPTTEEAAIAAKVAEEAEQAQPEPVETEKELTETIIPQETSAETEAVPEPEVEIAPEKPDSSTSESGSEADSTEKTEK